MRRRRLNYNGREVASVFFCVLIGREKITKDQSGHVYAQSERLYPENRRINIPRQCVKIGDAIYYGQTEDRTEPGDKDAFNRVTVLQGVPRDHKQEC